MQAQPQSPVASNATCLLNNCLIRNLCVDSSGRLTYFTVGRPSEKMAQTVSRLRLHPGGKHAINMLQVRSRSLSSVAPSETYKYVDGVHVAINRKLIPPNFGHTLADEIVSVFRALEMWQQLDVSPLILLLNSVQSSSQYACLGSNTSMRLQHRLPRSVCFRNFIAGWSALHYWRWPDGTEFHRQKPAFYLLHFRDHVWRRYQISGAMERHPAHIVMISKNVSASVHAVYLENTVELGEHFASAFGARVTHAGWAGMPLRQQVELMADADVALSLPGADVINFVFMPTFSAIVVPYRVQSWAIAESSKLPGSNASGVWYDSHEINLWFAHVPHRFIVEYDPGQNPDNKYDPVSHGITLALDEAATHMRLALDYVALHGNATHRMSEWASESADARAIAQGCATYAERSRKFGPVKALAATCLPQADVAGTI